METWKKPTDSLPPEFQDVIVITKNGSVETAYLKHNSLNNQYFFMSNRFDRYRDIIALKLEVVKWWSAIPRD